MATIGGFLDNSLVIHLWQDGGSDDFDGIWDIIFKEEGIKSVDTEKDKIEFAKWLGSV
jgi:hypothetical protein